LTKTEGIAIVPDDPPLDPGAVHPPWVVFPGLAPDDLPAKQGVEEAWFDQIWRPFWNALSAAQRVAYFDHWHAAPEWRDAIEFFFTTIPGLDDC
jgi:hypothetical protein